MRSKFLFFVFSFWIITTSVILLNIYTNTYGLFSDFQLSYKEVHNDRVSKYNWALNAQEQPEAFIFGSSNSMRFTPDSIASITGLSCMNFGLFHARAEDYWCMTNALIDGLDSPPRLIIFCLDDWNFCDEKAPSDEIFRGAEKRLSVKPKFSHYLDDYSVLKLRWAQLKFALAFENLESSVNAVTAMFKDTIGFNKFIPEMTETFYPNGVRRFYGRIDEKPGDLTDTCESGTFDVSAYLHEIDSAWKHFPETKNGILDKSHENFKWFSYRRLELFERTIKKLNEVKCQVIFNIMPNQPYFKKILTESTNYNQRLAYLKSYLNYLDFKYANVLVVKDNSDIKNFDGFENHFFDYMHPTSVNSNLMIETFRQELIDHAF
jgi:hypothetical protein